MIEYKVESIGEDVLEFYLNARAKEGWKLISVFQGDPQTECERTLRTPYTCVWSVEDTIKEQE